LLQGPEYHISESVGLIVLLAYLSMRLNALVAVL
jgi:hypothetical protein